jgi:hypothetical protein
MRTHNKAIRLCLHAMRGDVALDLLAKQNAIDLVPHLHAPYFTTPQIDCAI